MASKRHTPQQGFHEQRDDSEKRFKAAASLKQQLRNLLGANLQAQRIRAATAQEAIPNHLPVAPDRVPTLIVSPNEPNSLMVHQLKLIKDCLPQKTVQLRVSPQFESKTEEQKSNQVRRVVADAKQSVYEWFMLDTAVCLLRNQLTEYVITLNHDPQDIGEQLVAQLSLHLKYILSSVEGVHSRLQNLKATPEKLVPSPLTILSHDDVSEYLPSLQRDGFFEIRMTNNPMVTPISSFYPNLMYLYRDILQPLFDRKQIEPDSDKLKRAANVPPFNGVPIGRSSIVKLDNFIDGTGHYVDTVCLFHTPRSEFDTYFQEIGQLWLTLLAMKEQGATPQQAEPECYRMYYLFANMCPYARGSAAAAKTMLNVTRSLFGLGLVNEKRFYFRQADWVAFRCNTAEEFIARAPDMFGPKENPDS